MNTSLRIVLLCSGLVVGCDRVVLYSLDPCEQACAGKVCGADSGCGSVCMYGSGCTCTTDCIGTICGVDDGCGMSCPVGSGCCTPEPMSTTCENTECGTVTNNCGQSIDCGSCTGTGEVCGSVTANQCDCIPDNPTACAGAQCGERTNNCGESVECGTCSVTGETCGALSPNQCACVPNPATCANAECGSLMNNCEQEVSCGMCTPPETCGALTPNQCDCVPQTPSCTGGTCGVTQLTNNCGQLYTCSSGDGWCTAILGMACVVQYGSYPAFDAVPTTYEGKAGWCTTSSVCDSTPRIDGSAGTNRYNAGSPYTTFEGAYCQFLPSCTMGPDRQPLIAGCPSECLQANSVWFANCGTVGISGTIDCNGNCIETVCN